MEQREPDKAISFHEKLRRNTKPFVFERPPVRVSASPANEAKPAEKEIATPFANFKGTVEPRQFSHVDPQPEAIVTRGTSRLEQPILKPEPTKEPAPVQQSSSARGAGAGSAKALAVKQSEVAPETPVTQAAPAEALNSLEPMRATSSTRRIASAAPISLSRRSSAVADVAQSPLTQATPASSSPSASKPGRQLPRTAPVGSQKHRDSSTGGESNPAGCVVQ